MGVTRWAWPPFSAKAAEGDYWRRIGTGGLHSRDCRGMVRTGAYPFRPVPERKRRAATACDTGGEEFRRS